VWNAAWVETLRYSLQSQRITETCSAASDAAEVDDDNDEDNDDNDDDDDDDKKRVCCRVVDQCGMLSAQTVATIAPFFTIITAACPTHIDASLTTVTLQFTS